MEDEGESALEGHAKEINTVLKTGQALVPSVPPLCSTSHSQIPSLMHIPELPKHAKSLSCPHFSSVQSSVPLASFSS